MISTFENLPPPATAFNTVSPAAFDAAAARHLLRRMGYSATPETAELALHDGPFATVTNAFAKERPLARPADINAFDEESAEVRKKLRGLGPEERKELQNEIRKRGQRIFTDFGVTWLEFARDPANSPQEKALAWLQNLVVIAAQKVRSPARLVDYQMMLRAGLYGDFPTLLRSVMHHPAMIQYLDLNENRAGAPNENFARELFELFALGEGNYTEQDIKESARSLTGVQIRDNEYHFDPRRHDGGDKTLLGSTGPWTPDDVIRITVAQQACATHIADNFLRYFVSWDDRLPKAYAEELGRRWKAGGMKLTDLPKIVFTSQLFYAPELRATRIKGPHEYYIGLCRDLNVDTIPFPGPVFGALRAMGQTFYDPPNVRGWIAGKNWINSSTLGARRQVARGLFNPLNENNLNADDRVALNEARKAGKGRFTVTDDRLRWLAENRTNEEIARHLTDYFLPGPVSDKFRTIIAGSIPNDPDKRVAGLREVVVALLQTPTYQLC